MENVEVGNPIKVVTELTGVIQDLASRLARSEPQKTFHQNNIGLMDAIDIELRRHYDERISKFLPEAFDKAPEPNAEGCAAKEIEGGSALDHTWAKWEEMKSLYGDASYFDFNKSESRLYSVIGEAASIFEALKDNIIISYLRLCSPGPLSRRAMKAIILSADKKTKRAIGNKLLSQLSVEDLNAIEKKVGDDQSVAKLAFNSLAENPESISLVTNFIDLNDVFVDIISKGAEDDPIFKLQGANAASDPGYLEDKCERLASIKELLLGIMPMTLRDQPTRDQEEILTRIRDLKRKIMSITQDGEIDEWLDLGEIGDTVNSLPADNLATDIDEIATLKDMQFKMPGVKEGIVQDYADTLAMYNQRLYKYAVIGCGGILENMLKEFLYRRQKDVKRIVEDPKKRDQIIKASPYNSYTKPDNICELQLASFESGC